MKFIKNISTKKEKGTSKGPGTIFYDCDYQPCNNNIFNGVKIEKDSSNNIYVLSRIDAVGGSKIDDQEVIGPAIIVLKKYNSSGIRQWTRIVGIKNRVVWTTGVLAVDSSGNVCIGGYIGFADTDYSKISARAETNPNYPELTQSAPLNWKGDFGEYASYQKGFVVKFDTNGNKVFAKLVTGNSWSQEVLGVDFDSIGNLYVTGFTNSSSLNNIPSQGPQDAFVVKYDVSGNLLSTKRIGAASTYLYFRGIKVDSSNNIYIFGDINVGAGNSFLGQTQSGTVDSMIIKMDSSNNIVWARILGVSGVATYLVRAKLDSSGSIYLGGETSGNLDGQTLTGTTDSVLVKYDSNGNKIFTKLLGASAAYSRGTGVDVDSSGNIYLTGDSAGSFDGLTKYATGTNRDAFIVKRDSSGNKIWSKLLGNYNGNTYSEDLVIDNSSNVFTTGSYPNNIDQKQKTNYNSVLISRHDSSGNRTWSDLFGVSNENFARDNGYIPRKITTDSSGNIYYVGDALCGAYNNQRLGIQDAFLIKYNSSKVIQWVKEIGYTGGTASGWGCAVDSSGNIYVCGSTNTNLADQTKTGTQDLYLQKYNSNGDLQWTRLLGAASATVIAYSVAVDSSNNVYLAGYTTSNIDGQTKTGTQDALIVKYDSSGTKQWTKLLGVASQNTQAQAISIHSSGNFYISGYTDGNLNGQTKTGTQDLFIAKYDSSGTRQWTRLLGNSGATMTNNLGLKVSSSENIYASGDVNTNLDGQTKTGTRDLFITKYNSSGTKQWTKLLGTSGSTVVAGHGDLDSSENYYVTGQASYNNSGFFQDNRLFDNDFFITKFNSSGTKKWVKNFGHYWGPSLGKSVVIFSNKLFANGYFNRNTYQNMTTYNDSALLEYDLDGNRKSVSYVGTKYRGFTTQNVAFNFVDNQNNLYVCGYTTGKIENVEPYRTNSFSICVIKYNSSRELMWCKRYENPNASGSTAAVSIKKDSQNNLYVFGYTDQTSFDGVARIGTRDLLLLKLDDNGNLIWSRTTGAASGTVTGYALGISSNNNVYIFAQTNVALDGQTKTGTQDGVLIKYDSNGTKQWTRMFGNASGTVSHYDMRIDSNENIYVAGHINTNLDGVTKTGSTDAFLIKYNSSGTKQWTKLLGVSGASTYCVGFDVNLDGVYLVGYTSGNLSGQTKTGSTDAYIAKYDFGGNLQFVKLIGATGCSFCPTDSVIYKGNIYFVGSSYGTSVDGQQFAHQGSQWELFVAKADLNGNKKWIKLITGNDTTTVFSILKSISASPDGNIVISSTQTGKFQNPVPVSIFHYKSQGYWNNTVGIIFTMNEQGDLI